MASGNGIGCHPAKAGAILKERFVMEVVKLFEAGYQNREAMRKQAAKNRTAMKAMGIAVAKRQVRKFLKTAKAEGADTYSHYALLRHLGAGLSVPRLGVRTARRIRARHLLP